MIHIFILFWHLLFILKFSVDTNPGWFVSSGDLDTGLSNNKMFHLNLALGKEYCMKWLDAWKKKLYLLLPQEKMQFSTFKAALAQYIAFL